MKEEYYLTLLAQELTPALGCTEPVAIAYAAAKARAVLGRMPDRAQVNVSRNILKNALGVGIPGTDAVGLEMAAAMGIVGGDEEAILEVLSGITEEEVARAEVFASEKVQVTLKDTPKKLYIEVLLYTEDDSSAVVIEDAHTNITKIVHGRTTVYDRSGCEELPKGASDKSGLNVEGIVHFVRSVDVKKLEFLDACMAQSVIDTGIVPTVHDRILTLSTCTGNGHATRWVVQAVLRCEAPAEPQPEETLPADSQSAQTAPVETVPEETAPEEGAENAAADSALQTTDEQQSPESAASEEAEPQSEAESTAPQTQQQEDLQEEPVTSAEEPVSSQTPQEGTENP